MTIQDDGKTAKVVLEQAVNEHLDLNPLFQAGVSRVDFDASQVIRVNSAGVRIWMDSLRRLRGAGVEIHAHNCTAGFIEQTVLVSDFLKPGEVESLFIPFVCENPNCGNETQRFVKMSELANTEKISLEQACPLCGGKVEADFIVAEYLRNFLLSH